MPAFIDAACIAWILLNFAWILLFIAFFLFYSPFTHHVNFNSWTWIFFADKITNWLFYIFCNRNLDFIFGGTHNLKIRNKCVHRDMAVLENLSLRRIRYVLFNAIIALRFFLWLGFSISFVPINISYLLKRLPTHYTILNGTVRLMAKATDLNSNKYIYIFTV